MNMPIMHTTSIIPEERAMLSPFLLSKEENMKGIKLESKAKMLYSRCEHGECPICIDASAGCPVMDFCCKSCAEVKMHDWLNWLKSYDCQCFSTMQAK